MKWIVDRIEEDFAVIETENEEHYNIPLGALDENVKEGDILNIKIDNEATDNRKEYIDDLMNDLFI